MDDLSINNRKKRNIKIKLGKFRWDSFIDYYVSFPLGHSKIKKVINVLETTTCLRFREAKSLYGCVSGILFVSSTRCHSHLGRETDRNWQRIEIARECYNEGEILQLILRTLGVIYEHNRVDRNYFVQVVEENILPFAKKHFELFRKSVFNDKFLPYEYGSIMHFGMYNYSRNGDPNHCDRCKCPNSFEGFQCERYKTFRGCGTIVWTVRKQPTFFKFYGKKNCIYHLKTNRLKKIKIVILKVKTQSSYSLTCSGYNTLEVKYWKDKTVVGARFCQQRFPKYIISHNNYVILQYNSCYESSYVHLYFKEAF
ncbi:Astacin-like metalloendopeptidase [Strongyloides ratti]|uniref:Metalloendopeptidase n=1 Tax=Strongyloides ratti TaxID=34506 RepID=A0A090MFW9_STRRB|nr:Astacin-like metalloendopeptidase [Strongyloides ratti]CEG06138.1 Astacin-like metalloendopeptidase [Strongyloides ratti]